MLCQVAPAQIEQWITGNEDEHLEFKEARNRYDFEELVKYCAALCNEGGGRMLLGITDKVPRRVAGTQAFRDVQRTKAGLIERLRLYIDVVEVECRGQRVVVIIIPSRPIGMPVSYQGAYWMRAGDSLVPMTGDRLARIFDEAGPDFSAQVCPRAVMSDLDAKAIAAFRARWAQKSGNKALDAVGDEQLMIDAELITDGGVTYAALVLLGTRGALGKHLAQAEVVFEYRPTDATVAYGQRVEHREGFFLFEDALWEQINLRNDVQQYQDGLFVWDIPTFGERPVREAILNAMSHRDYRLAASTFIRQFPRRLEIVSPGGLPPGVTLDSILWKQYPRNRRIAEALGKCGLVERSGQGMNLMFEDAIKTSKRPPDFTGTDDYQVSVTLWGEVQEPNFLRFLGRVGMAQLESFTTRDLLALDLVHRELPIPDDLKANVVRLCDQGVVERMPRSKYILSRSLYGFIGKAGVYTRKRGLDRETNKALLVKHISDNARMGSQMEQLQQVLPALSRNQIQTLMRELKKARVVHVVGRTRNARWFPDSEVGGPPAGPTGTISSRNR